MSLYPLAEPLSIVGVVAGLLMLALFGNLALATGTIVLFAICGHTWRRDMPPIFPFCFAFQWIGAFGGTLYYEVYGYFPGDDRLGDLDGLLWASTLGFVAAAVGVRVGMGVFHKPLTQLLNAPPPHYNLARLAQLTVALFSFNYLFDVIPTSIWFGGAQFIIIALELRFVPYFILIVVVFQQSRGYKLLAAVTLLVVLPQLLTGFSDFKELMFIILLAALFQWRPWVKTRQQQRRNRRLMLAAALGSVFIILFGLIWMGGVKQQWRDVLWWSQSAEASPIARMGQFLSIVGNVTTNLDIESATGHLAGRLSSGSLYFSMVIDRVPHVLPHEGGVLLSRAVENAVVPRFLFPNKAILASDSELVRTYAGIYVAGAESGASIGLGYMAEFYIDFGWPGIAALCLAYGLLLMVILRAFAFAAPTGAVFIALAMGFLLTNFTVYDASFIKLFAGMIQRGIIMTVLVMALVPVVMPWLTHQGAGRRTGASHGVRHGVGRGVRQPAVALGANAARPASLAPPSSSPSPASSPSPSSLSSSVQR